RSHAIANGVYVAAPNRVGFERPQDAVGEGLVFWGNSLIIDPFGRTLANASSEKEEILIAEIDPIVQENIRRLWPFLRDRRIDAYNAITQRFSE
ncbi:MAG: acyltransferase, partial [Phycisphaerales bacterium]|nr:acyltransferase [Phycisphaerales bacterium]